MKCLSCFHQWRLTKQLTYGGTQADWLTHVDGLYPMTTMCSITLTTKASLCLERLVANILLRIYRPIELLLSWKHTADISISVKVR